MALDGVSPKPLHTESEKAYPSKSPASERAAIADRAPSRQISRESIRPDQSAVAQDQRLTRRYVPNTSAVLSLLDLFCVGTAQTAIFAAVHDRLSLFGPTHVPLVAGISVLANMVFLYAAGCYRRDTLVSPAMATSRLPVALGFGGFALFAALHYGLAELFPHTAVYQSVSQCAMIALIGAGTSLCAASVSRVLFYAMVRRRWFRRRILVLGTGRRAVYLHELMGQAAHRLENNLIFAPESIIGGTVQDALRDAVIPVQTKSIDVLARELTVDEVVIAVDERRGISLERLLACKTNGIPVTDYNTFIERETGRVDLNWLELSWLVYSNGFQMRLIDTMLKRLLDISTSFILLLVSFPVLVGAMIAIALEGHGNVLFKQKRVTQDGRGFWLYKLRTMRPDAEVQGPQWADVDDPRITSVGAFLRRTRIDEIPQLINVLRGDMSLVGPRPERPVFVEQLSQDIRMYNLRHSVKSGLTGWAQINYPYGASNADAERKLEYDLYYIKNYSLLRDISIILQTLRVLLWPQGVR